MEMLDEYYVGLTASGGTAWEEYCKPDWSEFVDTWFRWTEETDYQDAVVECSSCELLQVVLDAASKDPRVRSVEEIETLQLFQATYWKEIPIGFRGCFVVHKMETWLPPTALSTADDEWRRSIRVESNWAS